GFIERVEHRLLRRDRDGDPRPLAHHLEGLQRPGRRRIRSGLGGEPLDMQGAGRPGHARGFHGVEQPLGPAAVDERVLTWRAEDRRQVEHALLVLRPEGHPFAVRRQLVYDSHRRALAPAVQPGSAWPARSSRLKTPTPSAAISRLDTTSSASSSCTLGAAPTTSPESVLTTMSARVSQLRTSATLTGRTIRIIRMGGAI